MISFTENSPGMGFNSRYYLYGVKILLIYILMNWISPDITSQSVDLIISTTTLNVSGIKTSYKTKNYKYERKSDSFTFSSEYPGTLAEQKKILNYFELLKQVQEYCREVFDACKDKFVIFTKHPDFSKFAKKIKETFDVDWKYNITILMKDYKFIKDMHLFLKKIVESPSTPVLMPDAKAEGTCDWKNCLRETLNVILEDHTIHKAQIRSFYNKFKQIQ
jgi:hypothetical protein